MEKSQSWRHRRVVIGTVASALLLISLVGLVAGCRSAEPGAASKGQGAAVSSQPRDASGESGSSGSKEKPTTAVAPGPVVASRLAEPDTASPPVSGGDSPWREAGQGEAVSSRPGEATGESGSSGSKEKPTTAVAPGPQGGRLVAVRAKAPALGLGAWTIDVVYDPAVLRAVRCTPTAQSLCNAAYAPEKVRVAGASATGLTGTVTLATIAFEPVDTAGPASSFTANVVTFADRLGQSVDDASAEVSLESQ